MKLNIPKFSLNEKQRLFMINSDKYNKTKFKYKDTIIENNTLKYNVEFTEFWIDGGEVINAHQEEMQEFIDTVALDILENIIEAIEIQRKQEEVTGQQ